MTTLLRILGLLGAAAAILPPAPASAFSWGGQVGLGYQQNDTWTPAERTTVPHLDVNLGLRLGGDVWRPDFLTYDAGVDYRRVTETLPGESESVRNALNYRARASLFSYSAPAQAVFRAERRTEDFSAGNPADPNFNLDVQSLGGELRYHQPGRPTVSAGYTLVETLNRVPLLADAERTSQIVTAAVAHGGPAFNYNASYAGSFNTGTYDADEYDDHRVNVFAAAEVTEKTKLRISDSYYLRQPNLGSAFSPRQELNAVQATVTNHRSASEFHQGTYGYSHVFQSAATSPEAERAAHQLAYSYQGRISPEWRLGTSVEGNASVDRRGTTERRDTGESLGMTAYWERTWPKWGRLEIHGGPSVGLLQPDGESGDMGWGVGAGSNVSRTATRTELQAGYDVIYRADLGQRGTALRQQVRGSVQSPAGTAVLRGQLTASADRRDDPLFGVGASRQLALTGTCTWRKYSASLAGSVSSGISSPVSNPDLGDGLFLPLPYDTHSYAFGATASAELTRGLQLTALGRYLSTVFPDRPNTTEIEGRGVLSYGFRGFRLALEDRYLVTKVPLGTVRTNLVLVTAYRAFGSGY